MKIKTEDLQEGALDWAVWSIEFASASRGDDDQLLAALNPNYTPSTDWALGGPIIDRLGINTNKIGHSLDGDIWEADLGDAAEEGSTALIAAMRCYVSYKLGLEVEVPDELVLQQPVRRPAP